MVCMALRMSNFFPIQISEPFEIFCHTNPATRKSSHKLFLHTMRRGLLRVKSQKDLQPQLGGDKGSNRHFAVPGSGDVGGLRALSTTSQRPKQRLRCTVSDVQAHYPLYWLATKVADTVYGFGRLSTCLLGL